MNILLKNLIESGKAIIFLGAGASYGSQSFNRKNLPLGNQLAEMMAKEMGIEYANEDLSVVYSAYQSDFSISLAHLVNFSGGYLLPFVFLAVLGCMILPTISGHATK